MLTTSRPPGRRLLLLLLPPLAVVVYLLSLHLTSTYPIPTPTPLSLSPSLSLTFPPSPLPTLPFCAPNFTHHCPCHDPHLERLFLSPNLFHRQRHCPSQRERCRIPRPGGYRRTFPWPESLKRAWFANVPSERLSKAKKDQNWVRVEGDRLVFPGGGTSFPEGVEGYVRKVAKVVPLSNGEVRTALDVGCGVASFGGHLLSYNILTVSLAPRDVHEAQVQFALERGIPAMLGVLSVNRLPFPSRSFDMAHCARCLIQWPGYGGLYLFEIDRVLRPGGYWVLSGPPINYRRMYKGWRRPRKDLEAEQTAIEDLARRLCWKKVKERGTIAVWRKPFNHNYCRKKSKLLNSPPFCEANDVDAAWYNKMETCISPLPSVKFAEDLAGGAIEKWPKRLNVVPPRLRSRSMEGITDKSYTNENRLWDQRVTHYKTYIQFDGKYRNIMDMNAGFGGFAAALVKDPVWVMNVVPVATNTTTLGVIYERGLVGTYMDWCEAFSTYPRTYDLIHANGIFSMYMDKCDIIDIVLEMDRILRPEGAVIIRDHVNFITKAKDATDRLQWKSRIVQTEKGPLDPEKLLIIDNSVNT